MSAEKKRILLVDDDQSILYSMSVALQAQGYQTVLAENGEQGYETLAQEQPDLLVLDQMMPQQSGFRLLERLRHVKERPTPVIMITANDSQRHEAYARMLGVKEYLQKPFSMDQLVTAIQQQLN